MSPLVLAKFGDWPSSVESPCDDPAGAISPDGKGLEIVPIGVESGAGISSGAGESYAAIDLVIGEESLVDLGGDRVHLVGEEAIVQTVVTLAQGSQHIPTQ